MRAGGCKERMIILDDKEWRASDVSGEETEEKSAYVAENGGGISGGAGNGEQDSNGGSDSGPDEGSAAGEGAPVQENRKRRAVKELLSWVLVVVCAYLLALFVTHCVIIKAEVPTGSMQSTIMIGDRLIGNRLAYLFSDPKRGDIVMFLWPDDESEIFIKRVIGLPGDTVQVLGGQLYINGERYEEDYLNEEMRNEDTELFTVPEDCYFMMGDNRNNSRDSRAWKNPYVAKDKILGKAWLRYKPSIGFIK